MLTVYVVIGIVVHAHMQHQAKKGKYRHHPYNHVCSQSGHNNQTVRDSSSRITANTQTHARTNTTTSKVLSPLFLSVCLWWLSYGARMCECEYGVCRVLNMDSVRLFFGRRRIIYACVSVYADGVLDAVVLVFFPLFTNSNHIHSMLQDIIFSHGVPAMRTELFCNRVASKIL